MQSVLSHVSQVYYFTLGLDPGFSPCQGFLVLVYSIISKILVERKILHSE
jgi:hypothetical protein